jgi:uncharacterized protein YqeY
MLKDTISEDLKKAMKSGDKLRLETLRTVRAALMEKEISKRGSGSPMSAEDEIGVLTSAIKKRKESSELFEKGGRPELARQEEAEAAIIQEYLPAQLGEADIMNVIDRIVAETGASSAADFGKVMPAVMKEVKGKADGKAVQELVRRRLGA